MNEQEFKALIEKIEKALGATMDEKLREAFKNLDPQILKAIDKNSVELNKTVKTLEASNKTLVDAQKTQSGAIETLKADIKKGTAGKVVSFREQVRDLLEENKDKLTAMKNGESKSSIRMTIKVVGDMLISNNVSGQIPQADREGGITRVSVRNPFILQLVNVGSITSTLWEWVQQSGKEGGAAMTAEGATKSQADFDLVLASAAVRKVTAYVKVSKEMLDDIPLMESEINQELTELIQLEIDDQVLSGDGTGQNLTGILENAVAFAPGTFATGQANEVDEANNQDVLRIAINQIAIAHFNANFIVMHPSDAAAMDLQKASDGHYVLPPFSTAANTIIKGIPIVTNVGMTEGDYLVGDFTKSGVRFREGLTFDVGYESDDFIKNFVTILAEARLVHRVKSNHYNAFVVGDFATDKAAVETA